MEKQSKIVSLINFIRKPIYPNEISTDSFAHKFWTVIQFLSLHYAISIPFGILIVVILTAVNYPVENHSVVNFFSNEPWYFTLLVGSILAPIIEELTFRLPLRYSALNVSVFIGFVSLLIFQLMDELNLPFMDLIPEQIRSVGILSGGPIFTASFSVGILILFLIVRQFIKKDAALGWYSRHVGVLFYLSALSFGFVHLENYTGLGTLIFLAPILVAPQIIGGLMWGYLRIRYGFGWSILIHSLYNFIGIVPFTILSFASERLTDFLNKPTALTLMNLTEYDKAILMIAAAVTSAIALILLVALISIVLDWYAHRPVRQPIIREDKSAIQ
ncbi:CPBP family intramembrane metalloprotease [candidate division WWE3 bacterium]|nr:CPBP family intramembrane metalloprotease [candidate division WWE3 bacterium]